MIFIIFVILGTIIFIIISIIIGGNKNKTEDERNAEDKEQIKYLKNYKKKEKNGKNIYR